MKIFLQHQTCFVVLVYQEDKPSDGLFDHFFWETFWGHFKNVLVVGNTSIPHYVVTLNKTLPRSIMHHVSTV